jgi:rod shape-determining protein MreD
MAFRAQSGSANPLIGSGPARLLPVLTMLVAAFVQLAPVPLPGYAELTPAFALMTLYHWTIYRPDLLPPVALFAVGVGCDLLSGDLPGVTPLLFLLSRAAVLSCRRLFANRGFPVVWAGFAVLSSAAMFGLWGLDSLLAWRPASLSTNGFRAALTVSLFPIASTVLGRSQQALLGSG